MRTLFLTLVLANLAFFAWWQFLAPPETGADPTPLARQIEPQGLRIVTVAEDAAPAAPKPAAAAAAQPAACLEWGSFTLTDAPRAEKALEPLALGPRLGQRRVEESAGWWVYIPPQGGRQAALKRAGVLKGLGVEDYFVVQEEGPTRWAVSLGVFRTEAAAQARLAALRERGVRNALAGPRETQVPKIWLQSRNLDAAQAARLRETAKLIEGSELRECQ